jgi:Cu/Ag efflux protein CusF
MKNAIEVGLIVGALWLAAAGTGSAAPAPATAGGPEVAAASEADEVSPDARSRQATGTIVSVDRQAKTVTVKVRSGERTFDLAPRVQVKVGSLKATLAEIQPGKRVFIRYREVEGKAMATTVKVL